MSNQVTLVSTLAFLLIAVTPAQAGDCAEARSAAIREWTATPAVLRTMGPTLEPQAAAAEAVVAAYASNDTARIASAVDAYIDLGWTTPNRRALFVGNLTLSLEAEFSTPLFQVLRASAQHYTECRSDFPAPWRTGETLSAALGLVPQLQEISDAIIGAVLAHLKHPAQSVSTEWATVDVSGLGCESDVDLYFRDSPGPAGRLDSALMKRPLYAARMDAPGWYEDSRCGQFDWSGARVIASEVNGDGRNLSGAFVGCSVGGVMTGSEVPRLVQVGAHKVRLEVKDAVVLYPDPGTDGKRAIMYSQFGCTER